MNSQFSHEKLDVYQASKKFVKLILYLVSKIPSGNSDLISQLKRASTSMPLNIAEGVGKLQKNEKRRYFSIARGSALECAAIFDMMELLELLDQRDVAEARDLLTRIVQMLTALSLR